MSNLTEHARREMQAVGLFDKDADYEGRLAENVMELLEVFSRQGHSGMSASMAISLFTTLAEFEALGPLTDDPDEWQPISMEPVTDSVFLWQNRRQSDSFSHDGGKTYHRNDEQRRWLRKILPRKVWVKLPLFWKFHKHYSVHKETK